MRQVRGQPIGIDGYNLLITIESALSDGLVLVGRDGCYRDLAGIHGTYRKVEETVPALTVIADHVSSFAVPRVEWYLDRPVSNSGRLKTLMLQTFAQRPGEDAPPCERGPEPARERTKWSIELVDSPDALLRRYPGPVVTSDSAILDRCGLWIDLAAEIIDARLPGAWKVDLRTATEEA